MALNSAPDHSQDGFGDPGLLNKIDELRRLNIAAMVPLPQVRRSQVPEVDIEPR